MRIAQFVGIAIIGAVLQLVSCRQTAPGDAARAEIERLVQRTVPPGGTLVEGPDIQSSAGSIEGDWEVSSTQSSDEYREWLLQQLTPEYHPIATTPRLIMQRTLEGDDYVLQVAAQGSPGALRLHFHFSARPD